MSGKLDGKTALITGGAGYVGSVLTGTLLDQGHQVRVVDVGFFGLDHVDPRAELVVGSILSFEADWLDGVEAVVHLAGLSNDPTANCGDCRGPIWLNGRTRTTSSPGQRVTW